MKNPTDMLLERIGKTRDQIPVRSRLGKILHRGAVRDSKELDRIVELPRYRWQDDPELEGLGRAVEDWLGRGFQPDCRRKCDHETPRDGCRQCEEAAVACVCRGEGIMHLRPLQVAALQAIHDFGGLLGPIRVGGGKTLLSFLAGSVTDAEKVLLLVPAKLRAKTKRDFLRLRRHWVAPKRMHILSYELLSRDRGVAELEAYRPNLVIADEAHKLKDTNAACTARLRRYLTQTNPEANYVDLSGTTTKRSILEYHHRQGWAIPKLLQPLPYSFPEAREWASAIDEKIPNLSRVKPGALVKLFNDDEIREFAEAPTKTAGLRITRQAYGRRLMSAPAVVGTEDQFDGAMAIIITGRDLELNSQTTEAFQLLREEWQIPNGQHISMPAELWRHARELSQGFYRKWDPEPPLLWREARKVWAAHVREILRRFHDIDTPMIAAREVDNGRIPWAKNALEEWRAIKPTFNPKTVPVWIDDGPLQFAAKWGSKHKGIIWVSDIPFGKRLAAETGFPYYRSKGRCGRKMIEDETGTCIASVLANCEGRNLQYQFSQNLIMSIPPGGSVWEQLLGRTHRDGQPADEVNATLPLPCFEQWEVFRQARRDAEYIERTMSQTQKLNFADITVPNEAEVFSRHTSGDPLWCKDNAEFFLDGT